MNLSELKITSLRVREIFEYRQPRAGEAPKFEQMRLAFAQLAQFVDSTTPDGREKAMAFSFLQHALMFSNAALASAVGDRVPFANDTAWSLAELPELAVSESQDPVAKAVASLTAAVEAIRADLSKASSAGASAPSPANPV